MTKELKKARGSKVAVQDDTGPVLGAGDPSEPSDQTVAFLYRFLESLALDDRGLRGKMGVLIVKAKDPNGVPREPIMPEIMLDPTGGEEHFHAVATRIATEAHAEACGQGQGVWPFGIYAKKEGTDTPFARRSFTVHVDQGPGGELGPVEDGQTRSLLAQNQRHIEAQMRINVQALSYVVSQTNALLQMAMARNEEYERTHAEALALFKQGLDDRDAREAAREERVAISARMDKALAMLGEHVMPLAAGALATWMAKNGHLPEEDASKPTVQEGQA